jgi:hypothetical protein
MSRVKIQTGTLLALTIVVLGACGPLLRQMPKHKSPI